VNDNGVNEIGNDVDGTLLDGVMTTVTDFSGVRVIDARILNVDGPTEAAPVTVTETGLTVGTAPMVAAVSDRVL
jgi:hypothetical protein